MKFYSGFSVFSHLSMALHNLADPVRKISLALETPPDISSQHCGGPHRHKNSHSFFSSEASLPTVIFLSNLSHHSKKKQILREKVKHNSTYIWKVLFSTISLFWTSFLLHNPDQFLQISYFHDMCPPISFNRSNNFLLPSNS
jgi:hypothetical protein